MSFIAPQAYTKETLSKAFDWLQHQPSAVKEVATSPDILVSLYLRAQKQGLQTIDADAPMSARKFIEDLNALKKDMAQFDEPTTVNKTSTTISPPASMGPSATSHFSPPRNTFSVPSVTAGNINSSSPTTAGTISSPSLPATPSTTNTVATTMAPSSSIQLDALSLSLVQKVQENFNLSQPQEALRLLISLGYKSLRKLDQ